MNLPAPRIIVTVTGRTVGACRPELQQAAESGADVGEIRFDRWAESERLRAAGLFPSPLPLLATLRSRAEGGEGPDEPERRRDLLLTLARLPFTYLDVESARDLGWFAALAPAQRPRVTLIVGRHFPEGAPLPDVERQLRTAVPPGAWIKVVLPCGFGRFWGEILPALLRWSSASPAPFVFHTTGTSGPLSRAWSGRFGMAAVFAGPVAPGGSDGWTGAGGSPAVEPAQIPVDRMGPYLRGASSSRLFAVVGRPIGHSLSPAIHSRWLRSAGLPGLYLAFEFQTVDEFVEGLTPLVEGGLRGLNVTHPYKSVALGLASRAGHAAEAAGCANTLVVDHQGVTAENTDVAAVARRLRELREGNRWDGEGLTLIGSGGGARAVLVAAHAQGIPVEIVARRPDVARGLAREWGAEVRRRGATRTPSLVVNATPAGREDCPTLDVPWKALLGPGTHVIDFVYRPAHPFLGTAAASVGGTYEDGTRLLVYQAAESHGLWWGAPPAPGLQAQILREAGCAA
jgi:shikimate dehydrogenase